MFVKSILTPVARLIFETKNRAIFLERFFWRGISGAPLHSNSRNRKSHIHEALEGVGLDQALTGQFEKNEKVCLKTKKKIRLNLEGRRQSGTVS